MVEGVQATTIAENAKVVKTSSSVPNTLIYTLAGIGLLGGAALIIKKTAVRR